MTDLRTIVKGRFKKHEKPRIGLALGGGSARGAAHLGVLEVLLGNDIKPDIITGTSVGSMVGSFYAAGLSLEEINGLAKTLTKDILFDPTMTPLAWPLIGSGILLESLGVENRLTERLPNGLAAGIKLEEWLEENLPVKSFSDLKIPTAVVAADLYSGEHVIMSSQKFLNNIPDDVAILVDVNLAAAIRASSSIPWFYAPKRLGGRLLVDGAVIEPVPAYTARILGADIVIGVDLGMTSTPPEKVKGITKILTRSVDIEARRLSDLQLKLYADYVITPRFGDKGMMDTDMLPYYRELGYKAAEESIPSIKRVLQEV